jgi:hypothetical protein
VPSLRFVLSALALLATALVAGCGDDTETSSNPVGVQGDSYANTVCFIASGWSKTSTAITGYQAGTATSDDVEIQSSTAQSATETYITNVRGLPQPDDAQEKATYTSLQKTADKLYDRSQAIASALDDLDNQADQAKAEIELLYGDLSTSVEHLDALYPDSGVSAAVDGNDNCEELHT